MALNIKNEEVHRLAAKLAAKRGISMSELVLELLKEEEQRDEDKRRELSEKLLAIGREIAHTFPPGTTAENATDFLYDDLGLPK